MHHEFFYQFTVDRHQMVSSALLLQIIRHENPFACILALRVRMQGNSLQWNCWLKEDVDFKL